MSVPIRVTTTDTESGESETAEIVDNHLIVTAGTAYVAGFQVHGNGTTVTTVKGCRW